MSPSDLSRRKLLKATVATAAVSVAGGALALPGAAQADGGSDIPFAPVIDCASWGARPPADPLSHSAIDTNKIIVHHMAFPNVTDYSREHALQLARDCQNLHMDGNHWSDTGQHFTVSRGGYIMEGRHGSLDALKTGGHQMIAAHCPGENGRALGIENEGTYVTETPPEALFDALTELCVTIGDKYRLHAHDIFGHWDYRNTLCPGAMFYREFPRLRRAVAAGLGTAISDIPERRWPDTWRFVNSPVVQVAQYLLNLHGYAVPINSTFTADTVAAVKDFQAKNNIPVDVDATLTAPTWESLAPELDKHASGLAVQAVQFMLGSKGYEEVKITGEYDHVTMKTVQELQRLHGLPPNGKVSMSTWCALVGGVVRDAF